MFKEIPAANFILTTNATADWAQRQQRRASLIRALRTVAFLASHEQFDTANRIERARVARLAVNADDVLRQLLNPTKREVR